jgi:hypothetical protein
MSSKSPEEEEEASPQNPRPPQQQTTPQRPISGFTSAEELELWYNSLFARAEGELTALLQAKLSLSGDLSLNCNWATLISKVEERLRELEYWFAEDTMRCRERLTREIEGFEGLVRKQLGDGRQEMGNWWRLWGYRRELGILGRCGEMLGERVRGRNGKERNIVLRMGGGRG